MPETENIPLGAVVLDRGALHHHLVGAPSGGYHHHHRSPAHELSANSGEGVLRPPGEGLQLQRHLLRPPVPTKVSLDRPVKGFTCNATYCDLQPAGSVVSKLSGLTQPPGSDQTLSDPGL
eukprot:1194259-Prorocentrum_minimum.AAC.1